MKHLDLFKAKCALMAKTFFSKGAIAPLTFPLTSDSVDFGPRGEGETLTGLVSPRAGANVLSIPEPAMPGSDEFAVLAAEVEDVVAQVQSDLWPSAFLKAHYDGPNPAFDGAVIPAPLKLAGITDAKSAAAAVRMDHPLDLYRFIERWLFSEGFSPRGSTAHVGFVERVGRQARVLSIIARTFDECVFPTKYFFGRLRPEELFQIDGGVFTAYPEGCPGHPEFVAGHGAAAGVVFALIQKFWDLPQETLNVVYDSSYHFAQYRTFAGVHYADANLAGLKMGQDYAEIILEADAQVEAAFAEGDVDALIEAEALANATAEKEDDC